MLEVEVEEAPAHRGRRDDHPPATVRSLQAAFLILLPATAEARIVAADAAHWVPDGLVRERQQIVFVEHEGADRVTVVNRSIACPLAVLLVFLRKTVPARQLL